GTFLGATRLTEPREVAVGSVLRIGQTVGELQRERLPFAFHYAARSDVGMVRSNNEDSGYAGPHLLAMADGMGGHAGGDVASSTVIGALVRLDGEALGGRDVSSALLERINRANTEIGDQAH